MSQNDGFRNSILLVNAALVGIRSRLIPTTAIKNYALRTSWGITDRLRGVMGNYYAEYDSERGANFVNFAADSITNGFHRRQVENIPLDITPLPMAYTNLGPTATRFLIELDNVAWNELVFDEASRDLLRKYIDEEGIKEGDPYWLYYIKEGIPQMAPGSLSPLGGTPAYIPPTITPGGGYSDHTAFYYRPPLTKALKKEVGMNLKIEPVYNFYADTTPPYEEITRRGTPTNQVSEPMLTNFYCLESEMRNTGSVFNSDDYYRQITLNTALQHINIDGDADVDPWFGPGMQESKTVQFYTLYSKGLELLLNGGTPAELTFAGIKDTFETKYKNIVILSSDLAALQTLSIRDDMAGTAQGDKTEGTRNLPFYNKVVIGRDDSSISDPANLCDAGSFLRHLLGEYGPGLLDLMQLYVIKNILAGTSAGTTEFRSRRVTKNNPNDASSYSSAISTRNANFYFDMSEFIQMVQDGAGLDSLIDRIANNSTTDDNFILIRNYNADTGPIEISSLGANEFVSDHLEDKINYPVRDYEQITKNTSCYSEPLLYMVRKHLILADGGLSDPVQTFFLGRAFNGGPISYVDSQVKYGVKYRYVISDIRLIFGNAYSYQDVKTSFTSIAGYGRAVGNALGFYRPTRTDMLLDDVVEEFVGPYTSEDKDTRIAPATPSPTLMGHYIFKATNPAPINMNSEHREAFLAVAQQGTSFVGAHQSTVAEDESPNILANINLEIVEGMGFEGNESGGAIPGSFVIEGMPVATTGYPTEGPQLPAGTIQGSTLADAAGQLESPSSAEEEAPNAQEFNWDLLWGN